jgi:hypothetical protein
MLPSPQVKYQRTEFLMTDPTDVSSRMVAEYGWAAHARVHELFQPFVQRLYESLDSPLAFHLVTLGLERDLTAHLRFEESTVLPLYEERVSAPPPAGAPANFVRDHELLRSNLERMLDLSLLAALGDPIGRHLGYELVALDKLFEHHDERELKHLYPALGHALTEDEQAQLLETMAGVTLMLVGEVVSTVQQLAESGAFSRWRQLWDAWVHLRSGQEASLPPVQALEDLAGTLAGGAGTSLARLLRRDRDLVEQFVQGEVPTARLRLQHERTVDQTLRSTLRFALSQVL